MTKHHSVRRALIGITLAAVAGMAQAHPGHAASNFFEAVAHLLGWDHLMAVVVVVAVLAMALFGWRQVRATRRK